jgi:hypothetical protein
MDTDPIVAVWEDMEARVEACLVGELEASKGPEEAMGAETKKPSRAGGGRAKRHGAWGRGRLRRPRLSQAAEGGENMALFEGTHAITEEVVRVRHLPGERLFSLRTKSKLGGREKQIAQVAPLRNLHVVA